MHCVLEFNQWLIQFAMAKIISWIQHVKKNRSRKK